MNEGYFVPAAAEIAKAVSCPVMIAITGIHGNFYSNPFYYNIGDTLNTGNIDFVYAQTNDAFGQIETINVNTGKKEIIGSWNERFSYTDEDIDAYLTFAEEEGYEHIILAGHSLGANKVIYYLSHNHDPRVEHFFLLSPANLTYMMSDVTEKEKRVIKYQVESGDGDQMLPFPFMGWVDCIANTAYDWQFSGLLNNVHTAKDGSAEAALNEDLDFIHRLGIHSLPSYLIQYQDNALLMQSFAYQDFADTITKLVK